MDDTIAKKQMEMMLDCGVTHARIMKLLGEIIEEREQSGSKAALKIPATRAPVPSESEDDVKCQKRRATTDSDDEPRTKVAAVATRSAPKPTPKPAPRRATPVQSSSEDEDLPPVKPKAPPKAPAKGPPAGVESSDDEDLPPVRSKAPAKPPSKPPAPVASSPALAPAAPKATAPSPGVPQETPDQKAERDARTVYGSGFPFTAEEKEVTDFFAACGKIERMSFMKRKGGAFKGAVFVQYSSLSEAQAALDLNRSGWGDRYVQVKPLTPPAAPTTVKSDGAGSGSAAKEGAASGYAVTVENVDPAASEMEIKRVFKKCGDITSITRETDARKAVLYFASPASLHKAVRHTEAELRGHWLKVKV
mmetsp:Transcript_68961/g.183741  ORF Transcript_68961/g.183741 Transcript_68961/m.183741 type:complete len:363 (+) Transcript_68961:52-1140(+)